MNKRRTVLLSLEHKEREFLPKCLLAAHLIHKGFRVFLGSSEAIHEIAKIIGPSVFFHKSTHPKSPLYKSLGHTFVFLDEEGGITTPTSTIKEFCQWRYATVSKERQDIVFLPGKRWFEEVSQMPNVNGVKLHVTGWPRIDLWGSKYSILHDDKVQTIKREHGVFYLFPASFGAASQLSFERLIETSPNQMFAEIQIHKRDAFFDYIEMLRELSAGLTLGEKIIVRPHPSEDLREWENALIGFQNIEVIREGDVSPWILAAKAIIQFGSTTVIQSALNGKLNVQYRVKSKSGVTDSPSFDLCVTAQTPREVLSLISNPPQHVEEQINKALGMLEQEADFEKAESAVSKISTILDDLLIGGQFSPKFPPSLKLRLSAIFFGSSLKFFLQRLGFFGKAGKTVFENLPGGITSAEVAKLIDKFNEIEGWADEPLVLQVGRNAVLLENGQTQLNHPLKLPVPQTGLH